MPHSPIERARISLDGLSVGDALGETFFRPVHIALKNIAERQLPPAPWHYTDDTQMALSIVEILENHEAIDSGALAAAFARRYEPKRGYGAGAHQLLQSIREGGHWKVLARAMFGGQGSYGNGAAMRIAPLGGYFADDLPAARKNAEHSAATTHMNPEGIAGAIAVSIAAALAWRCREDTTMTPKGFLSEVAEWTPHSETRAGIVAAHDMPADANPMSVAQQLGSGQLISSQDTVPFAMWCAAHHLRDYEEAFWATVSGLGDRDTTCAIVGGIVALAATDRGVPEDWLKSREALED